jgi:hypothetical protein
MIRDLKVSMKTKHTLKWMGFTGFLLLLTSTASAQEFTLPVQHQHMIGSCKGDLIVNKDGIEYRTKGNDARRWSYTDIKMINLASKDIKVSTYESRRLELGRDETFEFKVLKGEVSKEVSDFLLASVSKPLTTSFVKPDKKPTYAIEVRHRNTLGGEQGTLRVYADGVTYESARSKSSRRWRWADIQTISRTGPFQFSITTYEPKFGGPTKTLNFDLKERMDDTMYDYVWTRVYKSEISASTDVKR